MKTFFILPLLLAATPALANPGRKPTGARAPTTRLSPP